MKKQECFNLAPILTLVGLLLFIGCLISSCDPDGSGSSGDDDDDNGNDVASFTAPLNEDFKNIPLNAGKNQEFVFTYTLSSDISSKTGLSVNLLETLASTYLSSDPTAKSPGKFEMGKMLAYLIVKDAFAAESAQITVHISYADDPDVCNSPFVYGPYDISGAIGAALSSSTTSVSADQTTKNIINSGSFEICAKATPPINAYLTVSEVVVDYEDCLEPEFEIVGEWTGYQECTDFGEPPGVQNIPVSLTITNNPDGSYQYTDNYRYATYEGNVCGNEFRYKGGYAGITSESGKIIFESTTSATKESVYQNFTDSIRHRCSETLNKIAVSESQ